MVVKKMNKMTLTWAKEFQRMYIELGLSPEEVCKKYYEYCIKQCNIVNKRIKDASKGGLNRF